MAWELIKEMATGDYKSENIIKEALSITDKFIAAMVESGDIKEPNS